MSIEAQQQYAHELSNSAAIIQVLTLEKIQLLLILNTLKTLNGKDEPLKLEMIVGDYHMSTIVKSTYFIDFGINPASLCISKNRLNSIIAFVENQIIENGRDFELEQQKISKIKIQINSSD